MGCCIGVGGGQLNLDSAIKSSRAAIKSSDIQPFVKVNNEKKEDMLSGRRGNIIAFLAKQSGPGKLISMSRDSI